MASGQVNFVEALTLIPIVALSQTKPSTDLTEQPASELSQTLLVVSRFYHCFHLQKKKVIIIHLTHISLLFIGKCGGDSNSRFQ